MIELDTRTKFKIIEDFIYRTYVGKFRLLEITNRIQYGKYYNLENRSIRTFFKWKEIGQFFDEREAHDYFNRMKRMYETKQSWIIVKIIGKFG